MKRFSPTQLAKRLVQTLAQHPKEQDKILQAFAQLIVEGRLRHHLPRIMTSIEHELNDKAGILNVKFTSPTEISEVHLKQLKQVLGKRLGKEIDMEVHRNHQLVGGAVLQVGDVVYDGSIRTHLAKLRNSVESYG